MEVGPTHSQSIEKIFNGMNNIQIISLNTFIEPKIVFEEINKFSHSTILIENKLDYGRLQNIIPRSIDYNFSVSNSKYPIVKSVPSEIDSNFCIITYGGSMHTVLKSIDDIFYEFEIFPVVVCLTKIYPLQIEELIEITKDMTYILTVEEGNIEGGFGSEIIANLSENLNNKIYKRVGSYNVPIPSTKELEKEVLVNKKLIINAIGEML